MAFAHGNQGLILVQSPQFIDPRAMALPPPPPMAPPPPPPAPFVVVRRPEVLYRRPVLVPGGLRVDTAVLFRLDQQRMQMLIQFMANEGLEPSPEEEIKRREAMQQLKEIVKDWIKKVARRHQLPKELIDITNATILTYGSYGLGVHGSNSDIDALCVGPNFANLEEDFFIFLRDMLQRRLEVSDIHCIKGAKVPLMRFKFNGISVDFPYAQLNADIVPDDVDLFDLYLPVSDETSWRSISGVRVNRRILEIVPNLKNFQSVLRCIKLWAKRRGIYSHLLGFFGGIHLAILTAYVCKGHPTASISALICIFFECFAHWQWPTPVMLQDEYVRFKRPDGRNYMPIMMPCRPFHWCNSNITASTSQKIRDEFRRGYCVIRDIWRRDFEWSRLFEPFPYTTEYRSFLQILLVAPNENELRDWVGWVKSRFRGLLLKLETAQGYCDPNPTEYVEHTVTDPNVVFYWGLSLNRGNVINVDSIRKDFMKSVNKELYSEADSHRCRFELSIVKAAQLPKNLQLELCGTREPVTSGIPSYITQFAVPIYPQHPPPYMQCYPVPNREHQSAVG